MLTAPVRKQEQDHHDNGDGETCQSNNEQDRGCLCRIKDTEKLRDMIKSLNEQYADIYVSTADQEEGGGGGEAHNLLPDIAYEVLGSAIEGLENMRSGLSLLSLTNAFLDDNCSRTEQLQQAILASPGFSWSVVKDLALLNRHLIWRVVDYERSRECVNQDSYKMEVILRKTVAELESQRLEMLEKLAREKEQVAIMTKERETLQRRLLQCRKHLTDSGILDMVFDGPLGDPPPPSLPNSRRKRNSLRSGGCLIGGYVFAQRHNAYPKASLSTLTTQRPDEEVLYQDDCTQIGH